MRDRSRVSSCLGLRPAGVLAGALALVCLGGCAGPRTPRVAEGPERFEVPPLPYEVFIERVEVSSLDPGATGDAVPHGLATRLRADVTRAILDGLEQSGAFVAVRAREEFGVDFEVPEGPSADWRTFRPESAAVRAARERSDLVLQARASAFILGAPEAEMDAGVAAGASALWFLTMFPAWFVRDRTFEPVARVVFAPVRPANASSAWIVWESRREELTFEERSDVSERLLQIVCPSPLVPSDDDAVRDALWERAVDELRDDVAQHFAGRFALELVARGHPFLCPESHGGSIVCLPGEIVDVMMDGEPPPLPEGQDILPYRSWMEMTGDERLVALRALREHLGALAPGSPLPEVFEISERYPRVYILDGVVMESREHRVVVTFRETEDGEPVRATWTLPALAPAVPEVEEAPVREIYL